MDDNNNLDNCTVHCNKYHGGNQESHVIRVIRSQMSLEKDRQYNSKRKKTRRQTMVNKILDRNHKIEHHESH